MKSFLKMLDEGRIEEKLFHQLLRAHLKEKLSKSKKVLFFYDSSLAFDQDALTVDIMNTIRVMYKINSKGDIAYDYEGI